MVKKILKRLRVTSIDMLFYSMNSSEYKPFTALDFRIQIDTSNPDKTKYFIEVDSKIIHESSLFKKLNILKLIHETGPAIGECFTVPEFKGKSIYPFVINYIAKKELLENNNKEVFILVNSNNTSSVRGIEKAGFTLKCSIKAKRFLWFYYDVQIKNFK